MDSAVAMVFFEKPASYITPPKIGKRRVVGGCAGAVATGKRVSFTPMTMDDKGRRDRSVHYEHDMMSVFVKCEFIVVFILLLPRYRYRECLDANPCIFRVLPPGTL